MGAWGPGSFDNDDAMDWVSGLRAGSGDKVLRAALAPAASAGDSYLEAPTCSIAVAAAEAVAAVRGRPAASLPEELTGWITSKPAVQPELARVAMAAVDRIARSSELKDLWDESESADEWRSATGDPRLRAGEDARGPAGRFHR